MFWTYIVNCCIGLKYFVFGLVLYTLVILQFPRVLGYLLGAYLRFILGTPAGAFDFHFEWIAIRLGFDKSEIAVSNFVWMNPVAFRKTEHLLKIDHVVLRFDIFSLVDAFRFGRPLKVHVLDIANVSCFMEKGNKSEGLNLWAALGAENVEEEQSVESKVINNFNRAVRATAEVSSSALELLIKYNPASLFFRKISSSGEDRSNNLSTNFAAENDGLNSEFSCPFEPPSPLTPSKRREFFRSNSSNSSDTPPQKQYPPEPVDPFEHWGVPFPFFVETVSLRNGRLFAQDFLNAQHAENASMKHHSIKFRQLLLTRKELINKPRLKQEGVDALYLDELTWRLVAKIINELFVNNKIAMTTILASAAANHTSAAVAGTTSVVVGAGSNVVRGVAEDIYTYNPKTLVKGVMNSIRKQSAPNAFDLPSHQLCSLQTILVRIISAEDLVNVSNKKFTSTYFCKVELLQNKKRVQQVKSSRRNAGEGGVVDWNETLKLTPVPSLECELQIRLFEVFVFTADCFLSLVSIPLGVNLQIDPRDNLSHRCIGIDREVIRWHCLTPSELLQEHEPSTKAADCGKIQLGIMMKG